MLLPRDFPDCIFLSRKDEINRGYFDDFGELKKNKGKVLPFHL